MNHHEVKPLLETIDEREQALSHQAEQPRSHIDELTTKLDELTQEITRLQITRTALLSLAVENIRSKLKRLVSRGILIETEPGLFIQPRP